MSAMLGPVHRASHVWCARRSSFDRFREAQALVPAAGLSSMTPDMQQVRAMCQGTPVKPAFLCTPGSIPL